MAQQNPQQFLARITGSPKNRDPLLLHGNVLSLSSDPPKAGNNHKEIK
jgi:hypothetical protein